MGSWRHFELLVFASLLAATLQGVAGSVAYVPSNSSLLHAFSDPRVLTIVLEGNYSVGQEFAPATDTLPAIPINRNVTVVGAPGVMPLLDLQFQRSVLELCSTCILTFENMSIANERRGNGASVDFVVGKEGSVVVLRNDYRVRLACTSTDSTIELIKRDQRRSQRLPLNGSAQDQLITKQSVTYQGRHYQDMVWLIDYAYDVPQSFQEGKGMVGGYTLNTINTTRLCQNPVPPSCLAVKSPDACVNDVIDSALLAGEALPPSSSNTVGIAVGVSVSVGLLALAAFLAALLLRRRRRRQQQQQQLLQQQQQQQKQSEIAAKHAAAGSAKAAGSTKGRDLEEGVVIDPNADEAERQALETHGWQITSMSTLPAFGDIADTKVTFGQCLGAGSYGRVYRARWAGQDVAVKVIEHDSDMAAAVLNEVQLMMNFQHPNIVRAFHYVSFTQVIEPTEGDSSQKLPSFTGSTSSRLAGSGQDQQQHQQHQHLMLQHQASSINYAYSATPAAADLQPPCRVTTPPVTAPGKAAPAAATDSDWDGSSAAALARVQQHQQPSCLLGEAGASAAPGATTSAAAAVVGAVGAPGAEGAAGATVVPATTADGQQQQQQQQPPVRLHRGSGDYPTSSSTPTSSQEQLHALEQLLQQQLQQQLHQQLSQASQSDDTNVLLQRARSGGTAMVAARQIAAADAAVLGTDTAACSVAADAASASASGAGVAAAVAATGCGLSRGEPGVALLRSTDAPLNADVYAAERDAWMSSNSWVQHWPGGVDKGPSSSPPRFGPLPPVHQPGGHRLKTWLVQEYCGGGTLTAWVTNTLQDPLEPDQMVRLLRLLQDAAQGLAELHEKKVVHGDLNARNVLVSTGPASFAGGAAPAAAAAAAAAGGGASTGATAGSAAGAAAWGIAKLADLGMSRVIKQHSTHRTTNTVGTMSHMPPELLRYGRMSPSVDVYAFGVMMWELFTRSPAFKHLHYGQFFEHVVLRQARPPVPPDMPLDYSTLMTRCWETDPDNRPSATVVIECLQCMIAARVKCKEAPQQARCALQRLQFQLQEKLGDVQVGRVASWDAMGMLQENLEEQWQQEWQREFQQLDMMGVGLGQK